MSRKRDTTTHSIGGFIHNKQAKMSEDSSSTDDEDETEDDTVSLPSQGHEREMSLSGSGVGLTPPMLNSTENETMSLVEVTIETNRMRSCFSD